MLKMNNKNKNILLVDCEDKKGLIHKISGILYKNSFNIISNREFVDKDTKHFYMRTEFEGNIKNKEILFKEFKKVLPKNSIVNIPERTKKKVVVLATTEHHCLGDLLIRNEHNEINFKIEAVISNHRNLKELVEKFSIPFHYVENGKIKREEHEAGVNKIIKSYKPDLLVLAKYMRILSPEFVSLYKNKIINIHHSFLPAFIGANPYKQAYERGVKIIGATAHFVNDELDKGPIIVQNISHINHTFDVEAMKQAGHETEKATLVSALRLVCDDKVLLNGNKTIVFY